MKVLSLVLLFVAVASANSMGQVKPEKSQCGVQDYILKNLSKTYKEGKHHVGEKDWECLFCAGEIAWAVYECVGLDIVGCVEDIIGAGDDCFSCICWVVEYLGFTC